MSSLSVEPCEGESILVTMFEIHVSEVGGQATPSRPVLDLSKLRLTLSILFQEKCKFCILQTLLPLLPAIQRSVYYHDDLSGRPGTWA
jgi:hypothetical protein